MRLVKLEVKNFCQHKHKVVEFSPRLTVFLGQNGSGKSNLLTAALGALTNDFSRTHGNKSENICQTVPESEPAYVRLTVEHAGSVVEIQRGLRRAQSYWESQSGDELDRVRGDKAVTERVFEFLGSSKRIINDYLFVDQGEIFTPLVCKEADRARAFQQLFGTGHAEKCWKALGEYISAGGPSISAVDVDTLRQDLDAMHQRCRELTSAAEAITLPDDFTPETDPVLQVIVDHDALKQAQRDADRWASLLEVDTQRLRTIGDKHAAVQVEFEALDSAIVSASAAYTEAIGALQTWDLRERSAARVDKMHLDLAALLLEDARKEPGAPESHVTDIPAWQRQTGKLEARRAKYLDMVSVLDADGGVVECPTCGTPVAELEMDIEYSRVEADKLSGEISRRYSLQQQSTTYNIEHQKWRVWYDSWQERVAGLREAIALEPISAQAGPLSDKQRAKYEETIQQTDEWIITRKEVDKERNALSQEVAVTTADVARETEALGGYNQTIADLEPHVSMAAASEAMRQLASNRVAHDSRVRLQGQLEEANVSEAAAAERLNEGIQQQQEAVRAAEFCAHLDAARSILHRDNLPKLVAQNYLELLESDINEILELFGVDFRVAAMDGLGFLVDFPDGRSQPASRLSGGQKVVLALAFRIAVNSLFAADLGVIALDEPTAYLDDENISCLDVALARLRDLSEARGLQCILITHEKGLGHLFDHVVQL